MISRIGVAWTRGITTSRASTSEDSASETLKRQPNLVFRKAKTTGKSVAQLVSGKVPIPRVKGEAVFGIYPVLEALRAHKRQHMHSLWIKDSVRERAVSDARLSQLLSLAEQRGLRPSRLTHQQMDKMTEFQLHNGVVLDASPLPFAPLPGFARTIVYLDGVLDPGNLGAIARSALFFGADAVVYAKGRGPSSLTPSMSKASSGALELFPVCRVDGWTEFEKYCRSCSIRMLATCDASSARQMGRETTTLGQTTAEGRVAIVMGDEGVGVSDAALSSCHGLISIPSLATHASSVHSLNVSVTAAIILHHFASSR